MFIPVNPDLIGAATIATSGRTPQSFLVEEMAFTGMDPVIDVAGAPVTRWSYELLNPTFGESGATDASALIASYRLAVEVPEDANGAAEALRDRLQPIVSAANPGETITLTQSEGALGQETFGITVGPEDLPTTIIVIDQHYLLVPRLVNDLLLSIEVTRFLVDVDGGQLPSQSTFIDDELRVQIDLLESAGAGFAAPTPTRQRLLVNIPSAGAATVNRSTDFEYTVEADGFDAFVDAISPTFTDSDYTGGENFGVGRVFEHTESHRENRFDFRSDDSTTVTAIVVGDIVAYHGE